MKAPGVKVHFEQEGAQLTAVEIGHSSRSPRVAALHRALFALGIVISAYQIRAGAQGFTERMVLSRRDGGSIQGQLIDATCAAILPIALHGEPHEDADEPASG
ncbi:MAG TPA: hypothetical protein VL137_07180 [Polyangiaceae bacterium]|nr:hypothetical protein [Polyangiaceae bacterium]